MPRITFREKLICSDLLLSMLYFVLACLISTLLLLWLPAMLQVEYVLRCK